MSDPTARLLGMVFCAVVLVGSLVWFGVSLA
ncbi:hypothetical protein SAMN05192554_13612 [Haloarchaeobius iranensis]|uniref:Uncharacterized protein n=1 Tax=Haloarchaeobius iranensis TaxID=996166 RepID=A0A1H0BAR4_9EURY|nr:hypothetical protein SAMN05192554_13612 [Haloarchaeobius iranensis]